MPELPEVHTTVEGLKKVIKGKIIKDVWSDYHIGSAHGKRQTIKNKKYFKKFKKLVEKAEIISVERRGKNILINLDNKYTIIVHMKMTGHLMYGVQDPFVHLIFKLKSPSNPSGQAKDLVLSDMRKFASVTISKTDELHLHPAVGPLGPEPLSKNFNTKILFENLNKVPNWPIKSALLNQNLIAGIGNIYSDEILFLTSIHPLSKVKSLPRKKFAQIYRTMVQILKFSIKKGGDSKSDYRNAFGEKGGFQDFHKVYGRKNSKCSKKNCRGIIKRIVVKGRSAHFCPVHQILFK